MKNSCAKEPKKKNLCFSLQTARIFQKDLEKEKEEIAEEKEKKMAKNSIPATGDNIIDVSGKKRKKNQWDLSHITYYNYDKKVHYSNLYLKSSKN